MKFIQALILFSALCLSCAAQQNVAATDSLAPAREAFAKGKDAEAMAMLKAAAAEGDGAAASAIGEAILNGRGAEPSASEAIRWFEQAVAAGDAAGHYNFAVLLTTAPGGVTQDLERARFLFQQAAEKNFAPAQFEYGKLLESDIDLNGPNPDWSEARRWLERSAKQGHAGAQFMMVRYCDSGRAGKVDAEQGTEYCAQAAQAGLSAAMNLMGLRYQMGTGIRKDGIAAIGWFVRAAQDGFAPAYVNLGKCYAEGLGVRQDYDMAGQQFSAAAKLAHAPGEFMLGQLFEEGLGTKVDPVKAFVLYSRAVEHGLAEAGERRDRLGATLSPTQKADAEKQLAIALKAKSE